VPEILTLEVNGMAKGFTVEGGETLLEVLRSDPGLRGTRLGCGQEGCGACVVMLDGKAVFSCTLPAEDVSGRKVLTIEGLGSRDRPHPLQSAMLAEQAVQCGYCLSGIIMSAAALLLENARPTRAQIVEALERHLCRCGSHLRIVRAIERASIMMSDSRDDRE